MGLISRVSSRTYRKRIPINKKNNMSSGLNMYGARDIRYIEKTPKEKLKEIKDKKIHKYVCYNVYDMSVLAELELLNKYCLEQAKFDTRYKKIAESLKLEQQKPILSQARELLSHGLE